MGENILDTERLSGGAQESAADAADELAREAGLRPPSIERLHAPVWMVFACVVLLTIILSSAYRVSSADPPDFAADLTLFTKWYIWLDVLNGALIGYIWAAIALMRRGVLRDLAALRPSLKLTDDEFHDQVRNIAGGPPVGVMIAGTCGALALLSMTYFDPGFWTSKRPGLFTMDMFFYGGRQFLLGMLSGVAIVREVRATRGVSQLGARHAQIDLLDLRPLHPFAHKGLRSAATWLVASSLVSLFWLFEAVAASIGPIVLVVIVLASWVFLFPLVPLHNAIVREKNLQLDRVRNAIRGEGDPLLVTSGSTEPRFGNLVAYYNLIEGAREWPIETPILLRLAGFGILGLGSWLGAAFVERLVATVVQ